MKTLLVTIFDEAFWDYGSRMLASFKRFNRMEMACCDVGLSEAHWAELARLGVRRLRREGDGVPSLRTNMDMLVSEFLVDAEWDAILVADADMMFLRNVEHLLELTKHFKLVIAPDRGRLGPETIWDGVPRLSFCLWATSDREIIADLHRAVVMENDGAEENEIGSQLFAGDQYAGPGSILQLDGDLYNWGRDAIADGQYESGEIFYMKDGVRIYPYLAHYSRLDDGSRGQSDALDNFYNDVIVRGPD